MKRGIFLAAAALLAMLIVVPMAMGQETTMFEGTVFAGGGGGGEGGIPSGTTVSGVPQAGGGVVASPLVAAPLRFRRVVVLPSFCRWLRCCWGRASCPTRSLGAGSN